MKGFGRPLGNECASLLVGASLALALVGCGGQSSADLEVPGGVGQGDVVTEVVPVEPPCSGNLVDRESDVMDIHDPAIAKQGDTYYIYSSSPLGSFYSSPDLRTWTEEGQVFESLPDWVIEELPDPDHIGAPDIAWFDGKWVMYYQSHIGGTCNAGIGVATNTTLDPDDEAYLWDDHGLVLRSTPLSEDTGLLCGVDEVLFNAIDPHLFIDVDGKPWLVFGSTLGGLMLVDIDPETFKPTQHPRDFVQLAARDLLQEDPIIEGAYIIHREGWYYLFLSHDRCCQGADTTYKILVGRSQALAGPYVDKEGTSLLEEGGTVLIEREGELIGTGHADVYSEGGYDYLVHHAYDAALDYRSVLNIRRLVWGGDGWPTACQAP